MVEQKVENRESEAEHIPSREEIVDVFRKIIPELASGESKSLRALQDEKGLYLWEIEIPGERVGETIEISYGRKGEFKESQALISTIQATYVVDGMPVSGDTLADFVDGKWEIRKVLTRKK